jgi:hypothetical protein
MGKSIWYFHPTWHEINRNYSVILAALQINGRVVTIAHEMG